MKRVFKKNHLFISIVIIIIVSFIFNARLFIPHLQLITTPEFELNDAIQLSYASKYWYWEKLHARELPFWSTHMGAGFPVLGEGQTGIFFLPNLLLYGLSPSAPLAYNLSLVLVIITTALGTFWWLSLLQIPWLISVIAGLTFACSGFFLFHLQHIALLQSFSLLPLIFVASHQVMKKQRRQDIAFFSILLSQQIFAGFIQAVFITAIGSIIYAFFLWKQEEKNKRGLFLLACSSILGILLAAPQLIPSIEFYRHVIEQSSHVGFSTQYSFAYESFLSFLNPFAIGNPKNATYYVDIKDKGLLFWETNGYVGIIPLLCITIAMVYKAIRKQVKSLLIILIISTLLMIGKYSPIYFIFDFFPFTFFRVPARFVALSSLMLVAIAAIGSYRLVQKQSKNVYIISIVIWIANLASILPYWYTYHEFQTPTQIQKTPEISNLLSKESIVYRFDPARFHRNIYLRYGWKNPQKYEIFQNILRPNTNIFWGITTFDAYPSRTLTRKSTVETIINTYTDVSNYPIATMSAEATNLLTLTGNTDIISADIIHTDGTFPLVNKIQDNISTVFLYQQPSVQLRAHFVSTIIPISTVTELIKIVGDSNFNPKTTALLEGIHTKKQTQLSQSDALTVLLWSDQHISVKTTTTNETPVVFNTTFYPGWIGTIDGNKTTLYSANITSTALMVPAGEHSIELRYKPLSFIFGIILAGCTLTVVFCVMSLRKYIRLHRKIFPI